MERQKKPSLFGLAMDLEHDPFSLFAIGKHGLRPASTQKGKIFYLSFWMNAVEEMLIDIVDHV
jgi:hypothetical protein